MSPPDPSPSPATARRRRRWPMILGLFVIVVLGLIASTPLLVNSPAGNRLILAQLDRTFAPGRLRLDSIRVSWSGPTQLLGIRLDDPRGKTVLTAPTATLSASLWGFIRRPGRLGTLDLNGATFDVGQSDGGTVDIADALGSIIANPDPRRDLIVRAERASLVVGNRGRRFVEGRMNLGVLIPASPSPVSWSIDIAKEPGATLQIVGELDRWRSKPTSREAPDFTTTLRATRWPLAGRVAEIDVAADLGGRVRIGRIANVLKVDGLAELASIRGDRPGLKGKPFRLASLAVDWSLDSVDAKNVQINTLAIRTPYGSAEANGRVDGLGGVVSVDLQGTTTPDWAALTALLAEGVEPNAKLTGGSRGFRVKGAVADGPLDIEVGMMLHEADLFGMKVGPTPIVIHARGDAISIEPIATTLNEGRLKLAPTIDLKGEGGPAVRFGKDSSLTGAIVNEEVSRRVLSYVAPILDRTTRASGRVSVAIEEAEFPMIRDVGKKAVVTGSVVFQDLQFSPGPLARQMFSLVSAREPETIRLDEPVFLSIADGRINQRGLAFPLGDVTEVRLEAR